MTWGQLRASTFLCSDETSNFKFILQLEFLQVQQQ